MKQIVIEWPGVYFILLDFDIDGSLNEDCASGTSGEAFTLI